MKKMIHFTVVTALLCLWGLIVMGVNCQASTEPSAVEIVETM